MFARRGGWQYLKQDLKFQKYLKDLSFINWLKYIKNILIRAIIRLMPNQLRSQIYSKFLRDNANNHF